MDRGVWQATVHVVAKSQTRLSDYHSHSPPIPSNSDTDDPERYEIQRPSSLALGHPLSTGAFPPGLVTLRQLFSPLWPTWLVQTPYRGQTCLLVL